MAQVTLTVKVEDFSDLPLTNASVSIALDQPAALSLPGNMQANISGHVQIFEVPADGVFTKLIDSSNDIEPETGNIRPQYIIKLLADEWSGTGYTGYITEDIDLYTLIRRQRKGDVTPVPEPAPAGGSNRIDRYTAGNAEQMTNAISSLDAGPKSGIIYITRDFETDFPTFGDYKEGQTWYLAGEDTQERQLVLLAEQRRPGFTSIQVYPPGVGEAKDLVLYEYALILYGVQGIPGETANLRVVAMNSNRTQEFTVHEEAWTVASDKRIIFFNISPTEYANIIQPGPIVGTELNMQLQFRDGSSNPVVIGRIPFEIGIVSDFDTSPGLSKETIRRHLGDSVTAYTIADDGELTATLSLQDNSERSATFHFTADVEHEGHTYKTGDVAWIQPGSASIIPQNVMFNLGADSSSITDRLAAIEASGWVTDTRLDLPVQVSLLDMRVSPAQRSAVAGTYSLAFTADHISGTAWYEVRLNGVPLAAGRTQWTGDSPINITPTASQVNEITGRDADQVIVDILFFTTRAGGTPLGGHAIVIPIVPTIPIPNPRAELVFSTNHNVANDNWVGTTFDIPASGLFKAILYLPDEVVVLDFSAQRLRTIGGNIIGNAPNIATYPLHVSELGNNNRVRLAFFIGRTVTNRLLFATDMVAANTATYLEIWAV